VSNADTVRERMSVPGVPLLAVVARVRTRRDGTPLGKYRRAALPDPEDTCRCRPMRVFGAGRRRHDKSAAFALDNI
jgi:hypothetical protein